MRLFVALDLSAEAEDRLRRAVGPLRGRYDGLRWTPPEGWHVTLAFLGEVVDDGLAAVTGAVGDAVAAAATEPIRLRLDAPGHFNRRILWFGVADDPPGAVATLGVAVQRAAAAIGVPVDEKPVHPHVTLARARGRERVPADVLADVPQVEVAWDVAEAFLYRSHLGRGAARYERLRSLPL